MALNWIAAIKLIPWADVVDATPTVVRGAKDLWARARAGKAKSVSAEEGVTVTPGSPEHLAQRVTQLEAEQVDASALINTLAEQNAQLVAALDNVRNKVKMLVAACVLLALSSAGLWLR